MRRKDSKRKQSKSGNDKDEPSVSQSRTFSNAPANKQNPPTKEKIKNIDKYIAVPTISSIAEIHEEKEQIALLQKNINSITAEVQFKTDSKQQKLYKINLKTLFMEFVPTVKGDPSHTIFVPSYDFKQREITDGESKMYVIAFAEKMQNESPYFPTSLIFLNDAEACKQINDVVNYASTISTDLFTTSYTSNNISFTYGNIIANCTAVIEGDKIKFGNQSTLFANFDRNIPPKIFNDFENNNRIYVFYGDDGPAIITSAELQDLIELIIYIISKPSKISILDQMDVIPVVEIPELDLTDANDDEEMYTTVDYEAPPENNDIYQAESSMRFNASSIRSMARMGSIKNIPTPVKKTKSESTPASKRKKKNLDFDEKMEELYKKVSASNEKKQKEDLESCWIHIYDDYLTTLDTSRNPDTNEILIDPPEVEITKSMVSPNNFKIDRSHALYAHFTMDRLPPRPPALIDIQNPPQLELVTRELSAVIDLKKYKYSVHKTEDCFTAIQKALENSKPNERPLFAASVLLHSLSLPIEVFGADLRRLTFEIEELKQMIIRHPITDSASATTLFNSLFRYDLASCLFESLNYQHAFLEYHYNTDSIMRVPDYCLDMSRFFAGEAPASLKLSPLPLARMVAPHIRIMNNINDLVGDQAMFAIDQEGPQELKTAQEKEVERSILKLSSIIADFIRLMTYHLKRPEDAFMEMVWDDFVEVNTRINDISVKSIFIAQKNISVSNDRRLVYFFIKSIGLCEFERWAIQYMNKTDVKQRRTAEMSYALSSVHKLVPLLQEKSIQVVTTIVIKLAMHTREALGDYPPDSA